ncbi:glycosyltransferase [Sphingomonas sp. PL-96]|uniref:glycosyltransferase n=1 Tax=Sphingomonas sp. PL-96 TaxID=2887201 RepID=UPI001E5BAEF6|nr:glycosyltransferase [Sphingomonas sp. PL-96]MCC2975151.1 glycosyltransferase [Sphingomonas sp. PL-96]
MRGGFRLSSMRVLYVTRVYPYRPVFGGEIAYSRGVLESLSHACDLTVLATTNGERPVGILEENGVRWRLVPQSRRPQALSLFTGMPNIMWRNATPAYHQALAELLREPFDAVVLDHIASVHALPQLAAWRDAHPDACLLYLSHEHERTTRTEKYASYAGGNPLRTVAMRLDGWKVGRWEDDVVRCADIVSLINPHERSLFEANVGARRYITTLPGYDGTRRPVRRITADTPLRIALLGGRGPIHKRNILRDWLDACAGPMAEAGIEMDVVGNIDPEFRAALTRRHPSIHFSGFVEDLDAHLQGARLGVVPDTVGRGVKVRLTSYIFSRLPMAGIAGAIDGLPLRPGIDFVEAPDLASLTQTCIRLVHDVDRLNRLQENAFAACDGRFDWRTRGADIVEAFHEHRRQRMAMPAAASMAATRLEAPVLGGGLA